jgi:hypothetical protein
MQFSSEGEEVEVELTAVGLMVVVVISSAAAGSIRANNANGTSVNSTYLIGEKTILLFKCILM